MRLTRHVFGPAGSANPIEERNISLSAHRRSVSEIVGPPGSALVFGDCEESRVGITAATGVTVDDPVQRGVTELLNLPALRFGGVELRTEPKLPRTVILSDMADALADVVAGQPDWLARACNSSQRNMNVWMLRIEMRDSDPFERHPEIRLHL